MSARIILNVESPTTQSLKAVCALLAWKGRSSNPLPPFIEMGEGDSRLVLVLSNKKDAYYCVTSRGCSCPAAIYHHGPCKHQRKYFPEAKTATKPKDIVMERKPFRPYLEDHRPARRLAMPPEETAKVSSSISVINGVVTLSGSIPASPTCQPAHL